MALGALVRGLAAAAMAIRAAAKSPAVRRAAVQAAQKARNIFSKAKVKAKVLCKEAKEQTGRFWRKITGKKNIDDILEDAKLGKVSKSRQFSKPGGFNQANKDFDALVGNAPVQIRSGSLRTSTLPDGTKVAVRPHSSSGKPTLEVQSPTGKTIKVRYD
jgi:hypothetical protein